MSVLGPWALTRSHSSAVHCGWFNLPLTAKKSPKLFHYIFCHPTLQAALSSWILVCTKMWVPRWSCIVCITKSSTVEGASFPHMPISSSVSLHCEKQTQMFLPILYGFMQEAATASLILTTLVLPCQADPAPADDLRHPHGLLWTHTGSLQQKWDLHFLCPDHRATCQFIKYFQK